MKRVMSVLLLVILFFSVVLSQQVTLRVIQVFTSPLRTKILEQIIQKFEEQNPGVKVELISPPYETAYQKIYLMVSAEEPLDIVEVGDWSLSALASMGKLLSLEPYLAKSELTKYLVEGVLESARTYKNTAYLLPNAIYVKTLFYRPDILSKYGITEPAKTMDELLEHCRILTRSDKNQYGFDFRGKGYPTAFIDIVMTSFFDDIDPNCMYLKKDGKLIFEDKRALEALNFYIELYKTAPKDSINWGFDEQVNAFVSGITPYLFQDPDTVGLLNELMVEGTYKTAPLPIGKGGKAYPTIGFAGWGITSYSKNKDLAWKFIEFFNSPEINALWCKEYGALPVDKRVYEMEPYFQSEKFAGWIAMFNDPEKYQFTRYPLDNEAWSEWNEPHETTMQQVLLGKLKPEAALKMWADFWKKAGLGK
ncbi:ABC transporter substrate-binding protein [Pseudothermotoga thermarum]|uniref:Extracellular solute-binding protein family 1 n=1 Tax=Pseudothermotoga thermarum DSM 5069 TaxID=688269 RepID=F7YY69_9THEM|nr:sugar ABC transporter substrate-binding protein [Pseudothermotoga thermarum]AEH50886.1 extracellular solute-binding protein family 1 [Pseudothermotoga thermarum DSM 5069]